MNQRGANIDEINRQFAGYQKETGNGEVHDMVGLEERQERRKLSPISAADLIETYPKLNPPIVEGLLRQGETANIIAPPKVGKSWLALGLGYSIATGQAWLDRFPCVQGKVLLIDNELHPPTVAHRLQTVAAAMSIQMLDYANWLDVLPLRGHLADLYEISERLSQIEPGTYRVVILDAWYRALPGGQSENDNASVAGLYNLIDSAAERMGCAWVNIHHSSKGSQAEKSVTDVGAGAGAQSRAADAHLILRPHEEDDAIVLEAVVRSFPPVDPVALRWTFPVWQADDGLDPAQLRGRLTKGEERQLDRDAEGKEKLLAALDEGTKTERALRARLQSGADRCKRLLDILVDEGKIEFEEIGARGGKQRRYYLASVTGTRSGTADQF